MDEINSIWEKVYNMRDISYRYYNKIKKPNQEILNGYHLLPEMRSFAIKLHRTGLPIKTSVKLTLTRYEDFEKWCLTRTVFKIPEKERYALRELEFRGFIPLENLIDYNPKKYDYIVSNKTLEGRIYIYPKKYAKNYKSMKKGYEDIHKEFPLIALEGWTKIQYTDGYRG